MMLSEEMTVVCGLLMSLNALDYNVMMSGEDYDKSVSVSTCKHVYVALIRLIDLILLIASTRTGWCY